MSLFVLESLILSIIFLVVSNWFQLFSFLRLIVGPKIKTSFVDDKWIKSIVKEKTGLSLLDITIFQEKRMHGMMAGLPFWPKMILSEGLYKNFNKDELEWVILHEAGHCVLWHNLEAFLIEIFILVFGIYTILLTKMNILLIPLFSLALSFVCIQIIRWVVEYAADKYSIDRVGNPKGVITAQDKFRKNYYKNPFNDENSIFRFLLHWNIYPSKRIEMANKRLIREASK